MKILWISNAPWTPSGYGSQSRQVGLRIVRAGYDLEYMANDGTRGDREWEGILVRGSSGNDRYSRDAVREDLERSGADWAIFLYDAWVFTERMQDPFAGLSNVAGWIPVDHYPTPLSLYGWLGGGHTAIAMSRFGERCLTETSKGFAQQGGSAFPVAVAPHAVDDMFYPRDRSFREDIGVPEDAYLVGIVAANNGTKIYDRKGFGDMAHALAVFMTQHPDAYLYVHSLPRTYDGGELDILFNYKGVPADRLRWVDAYDYKKQGITDDEMARRYSAMDVLLATSRGEGFGLPVIEAQACGTPVIASNWTAQAELVGDVWSGGMSSQRHPSGWLVAVDPDFDYRQGADFAKPVIPAIVRALNEAYEARGDQSMRDAAIAKAENTAPMPSSIITGVRSSSGWRRARPRLGPCPSTAQRAVRPCARRPRPRHEGHHHGWRHRRKVGRPSRRSPSLRADQRRAAAASDGAAAQR